MGMAPISREAHGRKRLKPPTSAAFARTVAAVPIVAGEIAQVLANYPVFFMEDNKQLAPFAIFGLAPGENLMLTPDGQWLGFYVPAILRLYPFMVQRTVNGTDVTAALLIDDACLSDSEGEPMFSPEGEEPRGPVARALQMVAQLEQQAAQTQALTRVLVERELLDPFPLQMKRGSEAPTPIGGLFSVSDAKLSALTDEAFLALRRNGALALAHAQLLSIGQLARLQALATARINPKK